MTARQQQSPKDRPRTGDNSERFAFRMSLSDRQKVRRRGGSAWLRKLIRSAP